MSLSTLLYFANQNYLVYIRTLFWLCTLVFEIYFSTLKHEAISIRVFTEKHPYTIKGQLFEELTRERDKTLLMTIKGAVSYYTHMLLRITNLKALGQRFQV